MATWFPYSAAVYPRCFTRLRFPALFPHIHVNLFRLGLLYSKEVGHPHKTCFVSEVIKTILVISAKTARILLLMSIPGQTVFVFVADLIYNDGVSTAKAPFVLAYLCVGVIQLMLLLYIAHILIHTMWKYKIDPDNSAIPYMTALGDLMGTSLLLVAFMLLKYMKQEYTPIQNPSMLHPT